jgi:hypothetical protein
VAESSCIHEQRGPLGNYVSGPARFSNVRWCCTRLCRSPARSNTRRFSSSKAAIPFKIYNTTTAFKRCCRFAPLDRSARYSDIEALKQANGRDPVTQSSKEISGGERGIRTLEGLLTLTPLAGVRLRPLGHLSASALKLQLSSTCKRPRGSRGLQRGRP